MVADHYHGKAEDRKKHLGATNGYKIQERATSSAAGFGGVPFCSSIPSIKN